MSWKGLSGIIKKSKLKYRFQLNPLNAVFSKTYLNSCISVYNYYQLFISFVFYIEKLKKMDLFLKKKIVSKIAILMV